MAKSVVTKDDGGAAFPIVNPNPRVGEGCVLARGMSLRDALVVAAFPAALTAFFSSGGPDPDPKNPWMDYDDLALSVLAAVDSMIEARKK